MSEILPIITPKDARIAIDKMKQLVKSKEFYYSKNQNRNARLDIEDLKFVLDVMEKMNIHFGQLMKQPNFQERIINATGKHHSELINPQNYDSLEEFSAACKLFSIVPTR